MTWLDPTTFGGAVAATIAALIVWDAIGAGTRRLRAWWERAHRFSLHLFEPPTFEQFGEPDDTPREGAAMLASQSGRIELSLTAREPWIGEELQARFVRLHLPALPAWLPLNLRTVRTPDVVCEALTIAPLGEEGLICTSGGTLNQDRRTGARRVGLEWGPSARREIRIGVDYATERDWSGVLEIRARVDERWFAAYLPARIKLGASAAMSDVSLIGEPPEQDSPGSAPARCHGELLTS